VRDKPVFVVTVERAMFTDTGTGVLLFNPVVLDGRADVGPPDRIVWVPGPNVVQWLEDEVARMANLKRKLLARIRVLGNFIWSAKDPDVYLDGELFGKGSGSAANPITFARYPSGDRRRGGDLEMWFWFGTTNEQFTVPVTPTITGPTRTGAATTTTAKTATAKAATKKAATKKAATKKAATKKAATKKATTKKATTKKATTKKAATTKAAAKTTAGRKAVSKKNVSKKTVSNETASKKPPSE
jgi:hypothetical protein